MFFSLIFLTNINYNQIFYHIYFHTVIIDIIFKNFNRKQQIANPLSFFGLTTFNKSYFIKNIDELIIKRLCLVENEQTVYYVKPESTEKQVKSNPKIKPGSLEAKSIAKFKFSAEERRYKEINDKGNEGINLFLDRVNQKLQDEYFQVQVHINLEENKLNFQVFI